MADLIIYRSNNLWDYKQFRIERDASGASYTTWVNDCTGTIGLANQPGNTAGVPAICYTICEVIGTDDSCYTRLMEIATSHINHVFGRNPVGRYYDYKAVDDFGATKGWFKRFTGGYRHLDDVAGVLDSSPKEEAYPYISAVEAGYSEGWVAFNTLWNVSLSYLIADLI